MAMTLNQLIEHLEDLRDEGHGAKEVMFSYNYGDYWRTTVAAKVDAAEPMDVVFSEYHQMYKVVEQDEDAKPRETAKEVIIIS